MKLPYSNKSESRKSESIYLFIYLSIYTQFDFRFLLARCLTLLISVYQCMENQDIPTRIQIERFIPVEIFRKKVIPFEILPFSCFYRNDRNFLYHLFGLPLPCFMSRESEKFTDSKWYNSIPFLFSMPKKKNTSTIRRKFFTEICVQM